MPFALFRLRERHFVVFRRGIYSFCTLFAMAIFARAAGDSGAHVLRVTRPADAVRAETSWPIHCGAVAASVVDFLKDYELKFVGEEFLDVSGRMLVKRKRPLLIESNPAERALAAEKFHAQREFRKNSDVVLHPEVCDELVDVEGVTDRRACEFTYYLKACGLLASLR